MYTYIYIYTGQSIVMFGAAYSHIVGAVYSHIVGAVCSHIVEGQSGSGYLPA